MKLHSETNVVRNTMMEQRKKVNGNLTPEHMRTTNKTMIGPTKLFPSVILMHNIRDRWESMIYKPYVVNPIWMNNVSSRRLKVFMLVLEIIFFKNMLLLHSSLRPMVKDDKNISGKYWCTWWLVTRLLKQLYPRKHVALSSHLVLILFYIHVKQLTAICSLPTLYC